MSNSKSNSKSNDSSKKLLAKKITAFIEHLKSTFSIGILITLVFLFITNTYYQVLQQNETTRLSNLWYQNKIFEAVRFTDWKVQDARFKIRGVTAPPNNVGLLAIDDRSVEVIGRWPWSREKIAAVIEEMMKYGAKSIGFDITFSEPQVDPTVEALARIEGKIKDPSPSIMEALKSEKDRPKPDDILGATIKKHQDRVVLGAFDETKDENLQPFQDYCRNEAFKFQADKLVNPQNITFIVDDEADPFVTLKFRDVLDKYIFRDLAAAQANRLLKEVGKTSTEQLSSQELKVLEYNQQTRVMEYCKEWLTDEDFYLHMKPEDEQDTKLKESILNSYKDLFANSKDLANLPLEEAIKKFKSMVKPFPIEQRKRWTINIDQIQNRDGYTGSFNADLDADGTIRNASMLYRTGNRTGTSYVPSLALQTYLLATGTRADISIGIDPRHPDQKIITKFNIMNPTTDPESLVYKVPIDEQGSVKINYAGPKKTYPHLPVVELFNGKETALIDSYYCDPMTKQCSFETREVKKTDFIKDKVFIFGATAIGIFDLRVTPFEANYPGPETHVNTIGNLITGNFIKTHSDEPKYMLAFMAIFGFLLSYAISATTAIPGALFMAGSVAALFSIDHALFRNNIASTTTLPGILILVLYIILFFYKYLTEERKKKYLRSTFSKYVSPAIVDEILKDPENIQLGGRKLRMSVFFSDVRGFTTFSEKLDPQVLSDVLNKYLTPMTNIVFANQGTLDKYMGDAVMAFFGAPISFSDHAKHACRCALQSIVKLKELQKEFSEIFNSHGLQGANIDIGIGINSGDMSVGNMGSDVVRSYTVMGDAVNLGSRLEGITKEYGVKIVISEFTAEEVKDSFTLRELDWVKVKGKNKPVRIFELICEGVPDPEKAKMLDFFRKGFAFYHDKKFEEAKGEFAKALEVLPEDPPSKIYIDWCNDFISEPPPENWDGVKTMKTK